MGRRTSTSAVTVVPWLVLLLLKGTHSQDTPTCEMECRAIYDPVCGSDGKTYANECILRAESCVTRKIVTVEKKGECSKVAGCDVRCTAEYSPVCGSNGKTYASKCILEVDACVQKTEITVVKNGECQTGECESAIDLVFALDASGSVKTAGFQKIKDFTKELIKGFKIGIRNTHVGVVVFSHVAKVAIRLDETFDKTTLLSKVESISYLGYTTATDDALRVSDSEMFSIKGGVRQNVPLVLVVLTDGNCTVCKEDVTIPARALKNKGVEIFSIAVGNKIDMKELLSIVSAPQNDHIIQVDNLDRLKSIIEQVTYNGCQAKKGRCPALPEVTTCGGDVEDECVRDQNCPGLQKCCYNGCVRKCAYPLLICQTPLEIGFALDSSRSVRDDSYRRMKDVVKRVVDSFSVSQDNTRFSTLLYSTSAKVQFNLVRYDDAASIKRAIDNLPHLKSGTRVDRALREAKKSIFSLEGYVRQRRPMVLVVVTDGSTNRGSEDLGVAAKPLKDFGVTVIAVGVGPEVNTYQLQKIASTPPQDNIITAKTFDELIPSLFSLTEKICREKPGTCPVEKKRNDCFSTVDECKADFECYGNAKCCFDGCRKTCKPRPDVCRRKVDLTFVVDHSNSVGPANFEVMKQFIGRTMEHFKIGPDQTRVSVVCFGTQANVEWTFNDYPGQNMKAANDALKQIRFTGGASRLDLAFDLANEGIYNEKNGMRKFAFKLMVILTDGGIGEISGMRRSIKSLKDKGVNFVALGVGPLQEVKTLETITQYDGENSRVFLVKRFNNMKQYSQDISDAACFAPATVPISEITNEKGKEKKCGPPKCIKGPKGSMGRHGLPGPQGPAGEYGPPGAPGPQGPKGMGGDTGLQGERGGRGGKGLRGMPGHPGLNGIPGVPGVEGRPGRPGQCGLKGKKGEEGPDGVNGLPGGAGDLGERGPRGPKGEPASDILNNIPLLKGIKGGVGEKGSDGPRGDAGNPGLRGPNGDFGEDGDKGDEGAKGEPGEPGKVLETIKGERGERGERGIVGKPGYYKEPGGNFSFSGPAGAQGKKGIRGDKGMQGESIFEPGKKGVPGAVGQRGEKGFRGDTGPRGAKGEKGVIGPVGSIGAAGDQGPEGRRGIDGLKGRTGDRGPIGPVGQQGEDAKEARKGDKGGQGPQGYKGEEGSRGPIGEQGEPGLRGKDGMIIPGATGETGAEGPRGPQGVPGNQGVGGMMGLTGLPGTEGDPGPVGAPGFTPPVVNGIDGMMGPPGPPGPQGALGDPGLPGARGPETVVATLCTGGECPKGAKGKRGPYGPTGFPGDKGLDGPRGFKGFKDTCPRCRGGDQGSPGEIGLPGQVGADGAPGFPGVKGERGEDGKQGKRGNSGARGTQGDRGVKGGRGEPGPKGDLADQPVSIPGDRGENGDKGESGPRGQRGVIGPEGPRGFKGPPGSVGFSPDRGERGIPGERGRDADKGQKGEPGEIGEAISGNPGIRGDEGDPGAPGAEGDQGFRGPKGYAGTGPNQQDLDTAVGKDGDPGEDGDPGDQGSSGQRGDTGNKGEKGDRGTPTPLAARILQGDIPKPKGEKGERGVKGTAGEVGPKGPTGDDGPRGQTGFTGAKGQPGSSACSVGPVKSPKRDVAFLIDSSASLREGNFMAQKNIVKQIIGDIYPVSVDGNRICVARYSDDAKIEVNLNEYFTNEALYRSIDSIPYTGGGSRFDKALKTASAQLFSVANGARSDAQKILILLTDGFQTTADDMESPIAIAEDLKKKGTTVFVLAGGPEIDWNMLMQIATEERFVVEAKNFNELFRSFQTVASALSAGCGAKGQKGQPGDTGEFGPAGREGPPGRKGAKGVSFSGEIGARGQKGPQGEPGSGIQGEPGPQGLMGFPGTKGSQGDRGEPGVSGPKGATGSPGSPALSAPAGPKGFQGLPGPKGRSGEKLCREVLRTDLAFFLDSSASLGSENFVKTKQFIKTIANAFDVSPANTHVSVITYASENKIEFDFQRYMDQRDLFQAIDNIPYRSGRFTYIDAALLTADRRVFTAENRARPDAFRAVLLLTDGQQSTRPRGEPTYDLGALAKKLRDRGIRVYVLGVGAEVDRNQLRSMVDVDHHLFLKDDFDELNVRIEKELVELNDLGCSGQKGERGGIGKKGEKGFSGINGPAGPKGVRGDPGFKGDRGEAGAPALFNSIGIKGEKGNSGVKGLPGLPGCRGDVIDSEQPLDLAFLMDASGSLYYDNYKKEKEFVKQVIDQQSIGRRQTRVSVMSYSTTATIHVRFDQYFDKASLRRAVDDIPYESLMTRIDRALALAKSKMFTEANGARPYARRVCVLLTDGQQDIVPDAVDLSVAAKRLQAEDVEIFSVGIGPEIDLLQLNEIVSQPSYVFFANDFNRLLREISSQIALALNCRGGPVGLPGDNGNRGSAGVKGIKGVPGEKGAKGEVGSGGRTGLRGEDGPAGPDGGRGIKGRVGDKGEVGFGGARGFLGSAGAKGDVGNQGQTGDVGPAGLRGLKGFKGPKGLTGDVPTNAGAGGAGIKGAKGERGIVGFTGFRGEESNLPDELFNRDFKGVQGQKGVQGDPGPKGNDGRFLKLSDPLKNYKGENGDVGDTGFQGPKGDQGSSGNRGSQGPSGDKGLRGLQGLPGIDGERGLRGAKGVKGSQGPSVRGPQGRKGFEGFPGLTGESGKKGLRGFMGLNGDKGAVGEKGPKGFASIPLPGVKGFQGRQGDPGPAGEVGLQGEEGDPLEGQRGFEGPFGVKGEIGVEGPRGPKGAKGIRGFAGLRGIDGEDGNPGTIGPKGLKGEMGEVIIDSSNSRGERGDFGPPGPRGIEGDAGPRGPEGPRGNIGRKGEKGEQGKDGMPGLPGDRGPDGLRGTDGFEGFPGPKGSEGDQGPAGPLTVAEGFYVVRHSQSDIVPTCPNGYKQLWTGYSWLYSVGNGMAHGQDLANAGSCVRSFSSMPFVHCEVNKNCRYSSRNDFMYWLSAFKEGMLMNPVSFSAIPPFISRCAVCETPSVHMAVHSQDTSIPECPLGWSSLWSGFSFLMMTGSGGTGTGESLTSSGSCLEDFRANPFIECNGARGSCNYFSDKFSFWLTTISKQSMFQTIPSETLHGNKGQNLKSRISRCRVCTKGRFSNTLSGPKTNGSGGNILSRR